jgi:23S rRNA (adenine2503-C2)-methyltransferase
MQGVAGRRANQSGGEAMTAKAEGSIDGRVDWLEQPVDGGYEALAKRLGLPAYRGRQVRGWVFGRAVRDFAAMTDLSRDVRSRLAQETRVGGTVARAQKARDGTAKILYTLADGDVAEAVSLPHPYGRSVCISSQVGCKMGCAFCASGLAGFGRHLTGGEMVGQVLALMPLAKEPVRRIVLMGMGEPLDNWQGFRTFCDIAHHPAGLALSYRHITVSSVGLVPRLEQLIAEGPPVRLAISLHSAEPDVRRSIMPVARAYGLDRLADVARRYAAWSGHRVTYEYALIRDVNDTPSALDALVAFLAEAPGHVNLIPLNRVDESGLDRSRPEVAAWFAAALRRRGVPCTFRRELGSEIDAACGQLRRRALAGEHLVRQPDRAPERGERGLGVPGEAR